MKEKLLVFVIENHVKQLNGFKTFEMLVVVVIVYLL